MRGAAAAVDALEELAIATLDIVLRNRNGGRRGE
jgi:hypothetical protein